MKFLFAAACLISCSSCAYYHWWRGDAVEDRAVDELNNRYAR
ncbi:hypothetical protein [Prosthecobacter vanneervenii]|uniref:Uncharacterized protein n=1 Tax=Prosthecobacter vanneervenii TaxID=48466 RepID=A0A7W8DKS5_9BACT|nr:hypothetical protein [Prosthecobacter vanneervenii]MBB5033156.1 hypothetical protein [Prosthecobacter vanneervenii]